MSQIPENGNLSINNDSLKVESANQNGGMTVGEISGVENVIAGDSHEHHDTYIIVNILSNLLSYKKLLYLSLFLSVLGIIGFLSYKYTYQFSLKPFNDKTYGVLITAFNESTQEHKKMGTDLQGTIQSTLNARFRELQFDDADVRIVPPSIASHIDSHDKARSIGKKYHAALVIWGDITLAGIIPNLTIINTPQVVWHDVDYESVEKIGNASTTEIKHPTSEFPVPIKTEITLLKNELSYASFSRQDIRLPVLTDEPTLLAAIIISSRLADQKKYQQAIRCLQEIPLKNFPEYTPFILFLMGDMYSYMGKYDEAFSYYNKLLDSTEPLEVTSQFIDTIHLTGYINRGVLHHVKKEYQQAIDDFTNALKLNQNLSDGYFNRGNIYLDLENYKQAIIDYDKAIEINPYDVGAYVRKGICYREMGEYEKAMELYAKAIELDPHYEKAYYQRGIIYSRKNDHKKAISEYTQAIEINPQFSSAFYRRGESYQILEDFENAIADYTQTILLEPDNLCAYRDLGNSYTAKEEYESALLWYNKILDADPTFVDAYFRRANIYSYYKKDYELAIEDFSKVLEFEPNYALTYRLRASVYARQMKYEKAIDDVSKAIDIEPNNIELYKDRGAYYNDMNVFESAIADFNKAIEVNPSDAEAYYYRGNAYWGNKNFNQAMIDFEEALKFEQNDAQIYYYNGKLHSLLNDPEQAIVNFSHAINILLREEQNIQKKGNNTIKDTCEPYQNKSITLTGITAVYYKRATTYYDTGHNDSAIADLTEMLRYVPHNICALNDRGLIYEKQGKYDKALSDFNMTLQISPEFDKGYHNRGIVYFKTGENSKAIIEYTTALKLNPTYVKAFSSRCGAYTSLREYDKAIEDCTKAIQLDSRFAEAYSNRAVAYYNNREYEQAISDYTMAIWFDPQNANFYHDRGIVYYKMDLSKLAMQDHRKVIELDSLFFKDRDKDIKDMEQFVQRLNIDPYTKAKFYTNKGGEFFADGDYNHAITFFSKAIEIDHQNILAYQLRGIAYDNLGIYDQAISDATVVLSLTTGDLAVHYYNRGVSYIKQEEYERAIIDFTKSLEYKPENIDCLSYRGMSYNKIGEYEKAITDLTKVLEKEPRNIQVLYEMAYASDKIGNIDEAISLYQSFLRYTSAPYKPSTCECEKDFVERRLKELKTNG